MLIALDYDGTFTQDPEGWYNSINLLRERGHSIIGVTMRYDFESDDINQYYRSMCDTIIYTGRKAKRKYLEEIDIYPDVWIDDTPEFICVSSS